MALSAVEISGGRRDKQTARESGCVAGLMLDSLEAERRPGSKLHLRQHLVSLRSYRAPSASGSEPQSSSGAQQPPVFIVALYFNAWLCLSNFWVKVPHVKKSQAVQYHEDTIKRLSSAVFLFFCCCGFSL